MSSGIFYDKIEFTFSSIMQDVFCE